jgi:cytochrome c oxidase subunit 1
MTPEMRAVRVFATVSAVVLIASQLLLVINTIWSLRKGKAAGRNPWQSNSLEWSTLSPPPHGNFETAPVVYRGPYEYSQTDRSQDYWPQHEPA